MREASAQRGSRVSPPRQADTRLLRVLTCGSVDDGKSTLIGRLLYDCKLLYDDQITALEKDSVRFGTTGEKLDMASIAGMVICAVGVFIVSRGAVR